MKTIEERATLDANKYVGENGNFDAWQSHRIAYIRVATEQDRIARQEERERCIKNFREWYCKITCNHVCDIKQMCTTAAEIRKATEGGEV